MTKLLPDSKSRIAALRALLKAQKLSGFIVPRQDEFQGEYVSAHAERLRWLTGFSGSWGMAIITQKKAAIFVDGRYTLQVRQQVDSRLVTPQHLIDQPPVDWIKAHLKKGDRLGFDPWLVTADQARRFAAACAAVGASLVPVAKNPIDALWTEQPPRPATPFAVQPTQFAGQTPKQKQADMARAIIKAGADAAVLALPDSVAWVFNLRGQDIPYTPVVPAFALLKRVGKAELFIDPARLPEDVAAHLKSVAVVKKPAALEASLKALGRRKSRVMLDGAWVAARIGTVLEKSGAKIVNAQDPCVLPKAMKNATEAEGARTAHRRDGAAMARFLRWLESEAPSGGLDEWSVAEELRAFREGTGELRDLSFETIPGAGPNAAIPHYHVDPKNPRKLDKDSIFLIDSGGQYQDGTTDITRTVIIGQPTEEMTDRFTRVLKGMIQLSMARFPMGTTGSQLDVLARGALWQAGLDFDHGTGHGVGSYLSVHEGPARINKTDRVTLQPGMILSNEPGYYKAGHFGIRIENLVLIDKPEKVHGGERDMLGFETLTLCPIDKRLIDTRLMTRAELDWLNAYHARVLKEVGPLLEREDVVWLEQACAAL